MTEPRERTVESAAGANMNVRANSYVVLLTVAICRSCGLPTRLIALMLPPDHQALLEGTTQSEDEESWPGTWESPASSALLFFVGDVSNAVRRCVLDIAPAYRPASADESQDSYWANHCEHCDSRFDDQELFCEPNGAFLPTNPSAAAAIDRMQINEPIEAAAAGCAYEPQFISRLHQI